MSHQPQRKEKNCLNCGAIVAGRYCQVCGQENIVTKQSFWGLVKHFIYDIFHFDGKFFDTLKYLLFKPGFIPQQYMLGKRSSFLDPIRMYLFTSAIFFLIFFAFKDRVKGLDDDYRSMTRAERLEYASIIYQKELKTPGDSLLHKQLGFLLDTSYQVRLMKNQVPSYGDTAFRVRINDQNMIMVVKKRKPAYVNINIRNVNWMDKRLNEIWEKQRIKYGDDSASMLKDVGETFFHKLPYLLFISLPFFAMILKLLYIKRKHFYYNDHAVFTLYHYIFAFILLLFIFLLEGLHDLSGGWFFEFMRKLMFFSGGFYLLLAMKRFYGQEWGKTILKFIGLNILAFLLILLLLFIFILFSLIQL